jgi:glycosidase
LDQAFNFPEAFGLQSALQNETGGDFLKSLNQLTKNRVPPESGATFLTNHDMERLASDVKGNPDKLKLAAIALLTLPGTPFIYYGEEIGLPNGASSDDRDKRTPMEWEAREGFGFSSTKPWKNFSTQNLGISVAAESGDENSCLETYRKWIRMREASTALTSGGMQTLATSDVRAVAYARTSSTEDRVVVLNFGKDTIATLDVDTRSLAGFDAVKIVNLKVSERKTVFCDGDSGETLVAAARLGSEFEKGLNFAHRSECNKVELFPISLRRLRRSFSQV